MDVQREQGLPVPRVGTPGVEADREIADEPCASPARACELHIELPLQPRVKLEAQLVLAREPCDPPTVR